jgi:hypothetical protein
MMPKILAGVDFGFDRDSTVVVVGALAWSKEEQQLLRDRRVFVDGVEFVVTETSRRKIQLEGDTKRRPYTLFFCEPKTGP